MSAADLPARYLALAPPDQLKQATAALSPSPVAQLPLSTNAAPAALLGAAAAALPHAALAADEFAPRGITPEDTFIFVLGCVPFVRPLVERALLPA